MPAPFGSFSQAQLALGSAETRATIPETPHEQKVYPRIQIISVADLVEKGRRPNLPPLVAAPYQRAAKIGAKQGQQQSLFGASEG